MPNEIGDLIYYTLHLFTTIYFWAFILIYIGRTLKQKISLIATAIVIAVNLYFCYIDFFPFQIDPSSSTMENMSMQFLLYSPSLVSIISQIVISIQLHKNTLSGKERTSLRRVGLSNILAIVIVFILGSIVPLVISNISFEVFDTYMVVQNHLMAWIYAIPVALLLNFALARKKIESGNDYTFSE